MKARAYFCKWVWAHYLHHATGYRGGGSWKRLLSRVSHTLNILFPGVAHNSTTDWATVSTSREKQTHKKVDKRNLGRDNRKSVTCGVWGGLGTEMENARDSKVHARAGSGKERRRESKDTNGNMRGDAIWTKFLGSMSFSHLFTQVGIFTLA